MKSISLTLLYIAIAWVWVLPAEGQGYAGTLTTPQGQYRLDYMRKQDMAANYDKRSMQGAGVYKDKLYQFYDQGVALLVYDLKTGRLVKEVKGPLYPGAEETHFGSVAFSTERSYTDALGRKVKTRTPLVYVSGHMKPVNKVEAVDDTCNYEFVDVADLDHRCLVKRLKLRNRYDDVIVAWDFAHRRGWVVGYVKTGYATSSYCITEFSMDSVDSEGYLREARPVEFPNDGTLQDCVYHDGRIFFLVGWGTNARRTTQGKIHVYDVSSRRIQASLATHIADDCEGLGLDLKRHRFIITSRCIYGASKGQGSWWNIPFSSRLFPTGE